MERIRATATRLSASASDLADRHDQLQGAVSEALTEIDAILSGDEG